MITRRGAALLSVAVVALWIEGCAWIVAPDVRQDWCDRLAAAQHNLSQERADIEVAGDAARLNQLGFIEDIRSLRPDNEQTNADAFDSISEISKWSESQKGATDAIKDIEEDLSILKDEIEVGGI